MITEQDIQRFQGCDTPFYFYDLEGLRKHVQAIQTEARSSGFHVHYAMKANSLPSILKLVLDEGLGVDCVSGQEVQAAFDAGFQPNQVAFAGVGKSDQEIELAIEHDIFSLNVESVEELQVIQEIASRMGKTARIALRLNPDVDAKTHKYITTGLEENKFGISAWQLEEAMQLIKSSASIELTGLHFHIGSQIQSLEPFRNLCARINALNEKFLDAGFNIRHINAGGGLGLDYNTPDNPVNPDLKAFFKLFSELLTLNPNQQLHFELGRAIVGNYGDLISRVLYVKRGIKTNFLILDAGMTELIRPALYQSVHKIENLSGNGETQELYDVVGPVCESSDCFGKAIHLPTSKRGDLIAIRTAGAYGQSMASNYNLRTLKETLYRG